MNIKSLLLGSAAGLVAVSGAQAADAIVYAEPEPVEYVRVCDMFGAGFFYIPGTETCLQIGGYARYDVGVGRHGLRGTRITAGATPGTTIVDDFDTYFKRGRFALTMDARSDTELGTLRAYYSGLFDHDMGQNATTVTQGQALRAVPFTGTTTYKIEHAYLELGGFRAGVTDSLFTTATGYTLSSTINGSSVLRYGPFTTHQISYTFRGAHGFSAGLGLETGSTFQAIDDYAPHVVANVGITQGWGGVRGVVAYDSVSENVAAKVRADINLGGAGSLFVMGGYADGPTPYAPWSIASATLPASEWMVQGGGRLNVSSVASIGAAVSYEDSGRWGALANVVYQPVTGLTIIPEVTYTDDNADRAWGGALRLQRSF